jgi:hypothetical protein
MGREQPNRRKSWTCTTMNFPCQNCHTGVHSNIWWLEGRYRCFIRDAGFDCDPGSDCGPGFNVSTAAQVPTAAQKDLDNDFLHVLIQARGTSFRCRCGRTFNLTLKSERCRTGGPGHAIVACLFYTRFNPFLSLYSHAGKYLRDMNLCVTLDTLNISFKSKYTICR